MSCALLRRVRGASLRYAFRLTAQALATLAVAGVPTRLAHHVTRYLFADPDHVDLPTGDRVPLGRHGRTEHGFLPEDAWKERWVAKARRAALERNGGPRVPRGPEGSRDRDTGGLKPEAGPPRGTTNDG